MVYRSVHIPKHKAKHLIIRENLGNREEITKSLVCLALITIEICRKNLILKSIFIDIMIYYGIGYSI